MNRKSRLRLLATTGVAVAALQISFIAPSSHADPLVTPLAYVLGNQVSAVAPALPGDPFGLRVGLEDYFNQGGQFANVFEHGYVGVSNPNQSYSWTNYVGAIPSRAYLPPCASPVDSPCIESVSTRWAGTTDWNYGYLSPNQPHFDYGAICLVCTPDYAPFAAIPFNKSGLYGGVPSMWSLPYAPHGGGIDYRVDVQLNKKVSTNGGCGIDPCTFIQIVPLKLGPSKTFNTIDIPSSPVGRGVDFTQYEFRHNMEFKIVLRLAGAGALKPDGFFFGRLEHLDMGYYSGALERLAISGAPTRVPFAQVSGVPIANIPNNVLNKIDPNLRNTWTCKAVSFESCVMQFSSSSNNPILYDFNAWESLGLHTIASGTIWEVRATKPPSLGNCAHLMSNNGITGTLSTNSTLYSADVPQWDPATHSFTFTVASTHLDQLGAPNRGYYQFALRTNVVNCLWGSSASVSNAKVKVVSEGGIQQVATTNVDVVNGVFYFTVPNFGYSNPKISVSFASRPKAVTTATPAPALKKSISCAKGKVIKKILAVKPVCPKGFKKQ